MAMGNTLKAQNPWGKCKITFNQLIEQMLSPCNHSRGFRQSTYAKEAVGLVFALKDRARLLRVG